MAYTLGKQLAQARSQQHLSVEDVAHRTRIPASIVGYLENDDYSHFPNLVYAKGFLKMYSRYLEVDASEFLEELSEISTPQQESPFLQAQATREELSLLSKRQVNLDFIPWQKILSILFFVGVSIPAAMFIAKLYKDNMPKLKEAAAPPAVEVPAPLNDPAIPAAEPAPEVPALSLEPVAEGTDEIPKATPVETNGETETVEVPTAPPATDVSAPAEAPPNTTAATEDGTEDEEPTSPVAQTPSANED